MSDSRQKLGRRSEEFVCEYLRGKGYKVVGRNYRSYVGEIDIVAAKGDTVYVVEVRSRRVKVGYNSDTFGGIVQTVGRSKISKIMKTAMQFVREYEYESKDVVVLIAAVTWYNSGRAHVEMTPVY